MVYVCMCVCAVCQLVVNPSCVVCVPVAWRVVVYACSDVPSYNEMYARILTKTPKLFVDVSVSMMSALHRRGRWRWL